VTEHNPRPATFRFGSSAHVFCLSSRKHNDRQPRNHNTICAWKEAVADISICRRAWLAVDGRCCSVQLGAGWFILRKAIHLPPSWQQLLRRQCCKLPISVGSSSGCRAFLVLRRVRSSSLSEALLVEMEVQSALRRNEKPFSTAYKAAVLNMKLAPPGLVPNWKHLATPVGCLLQWQRIRNALFHAHDYRSQRFGSTESARS